jgi:co-chaperonin GroES (HSP10)
VERELTIQLPTAEAQEIDYGQAASVIRPLPGRFYAIEHGRAKKIGSIFLSEGAGTSLQSDALTVIAAGEGVSLSPGESILVRPTHGEWIEGFEVPGYKAEQRVRVYGTGAAFQGQPFRVDWWECAPCKVHTASFMGGLGVLTPINSVHISRTNMAIEATGRNIIIKRDPTVTSESGIELPESAQYRSCLATVLSVGKQVRDVKVGDRVHYAPMGLLDFMFGDDPDLACVTELAINAVIEEVAA